MSLGGEHIADIPSYIFGQHSSLSASLAPSEVAQSGVELSYIYMLIIVVATALYLLWINYWSSRGSNHKRLFGFLGYHRGDYTSKMEVVSHPLFGRYLTSGTVVGMLSIWVISISLLGLTEEYLLRQVVMVLLGVIAIFAYKYLIISLLGVVLDARIFAKTILHIRGVAYTLAALFVAPMAFCFSLAKFETKDVFFYIIVTQLIAVLLIFIYETFLLFLTKKVSLLHTILYLCTVEIFPISLIWGFFYR